MKNYPFPSPRTHSKRAEGEQGMSTSWINMSIFLTKSNLNRLKENNKRIYNFGWQLANNKEIHDLIINFKKF